jgi:hypothetical protein
MGCSSAAADLDSGTRMAADGTTRCSKVVEGADRRWRRPEAAESAGVEPVEASLEVVL